MATPPCVPTEPVNDNPIEDVTSTSAADTTEAPGTQHLSMNVVRSVDLAHANTSPSQEAMAIQQDMKDKKEEDTDITLAEVPSVITAEPNEPECSTLPQAPAKIFRFLDLPAEIRNMIYRYSLMRRTFGYRPELMLSSPFQDDKKMVTFFATKFKQSLSLLYVCRRISTEAKAALYGSYRFVFCEFKEAEEFLTNIGSNIDLLKNVDVYAGLDVIRGLDDKIDPRGFLSLLSKATRLTCFRIRIYWGNCYAIQDHPTVQDRPDGSGRDVVKVILPVLKMLHKRDKPHGVFGSVHFLRADRCHVADKGGVYIHSDILVPCRQCWKWQLALREFRDEVEGEWNKRKETLLEG